jgi:hypothetical protein
MILKNLFTGGTFVHPEIARQRYSICKSCESYNFEYDLCRECYCKMGIKTKLGGMLCPLQKWAKLDSNKKEK